MLPVGISFLSYRHHQVLVDGVTDQAPCTPSLAFTGFHMGCIIYQKHFSGTNALPMACSNAAHVCSDCCMQLNTVVLFWSTAVTHKSVLSTKPNPAMVQQCPEMAHIMSVRNLSSASIWNSGVLTAAQIWGPAPFPCLMPAIGAPHAMCLVMSLNFHTWIGHGVACHGVCSAYFEWPPYLLPVCIDSEQ